MIIPQDTSLDYTASVLLIKKDTVLLHYHEKIKKWLQPGGHIETNELPHEAAAREVKEETGITITLPEKQLEDNSYNLQTPSRINTHQISSDHWHCDFTYIKKVSEETTSKIGEWFTIQDIKNTENIPKNIETLAITTLTPPNREQDL